MKLNSDGPFIAAEFRVELIQGMKKIKKSGRDEMLVLGRKPGEYVMIGDNVRVSVVKTDKGALRLAIDAPLDVKIERGEVFEGKMNKKTENTI